MGLDVSGDKDFFLIFVVEVCLLTMLWNLMNPFS